MGAAVQQDSFDEEEFRRYAARLRADLEALRVVCARPDFGRGAKSLGAELEVHLVDAIGGPSLLSRAVLADTLGASVTLEMDRFNLEINTDPLDLGGTSFATLESQLERALAALRTAAHPHGARIMVIGILPTLVEADLQSSALTATHRYRALSNGIRRLRNEPSQVLIEGHDRVEISTDDVTLEGANTSFQVHLRVDPQDFARAFNAAQIATGPVLAASGNSPIFLQRRLWDETRVALFRQAVDHRSGIDEEDWRAARVSFGHGWVRKGALEIFEENVAMHEPLLPVCDDEDPIAIARAGGVPKLASLRLHHGTVWRWNRPVYDAADGGHLRIEFRALPAGPTVTDMMANAAFIVGLTLALMPRADALVTQMTFGHARRNFYRAAQHGLDAELLWPADSTPSPEPHNARELLRRLLPMALDGLVSAGVDHDDAARRLAIVERRVARGITGARWQRAVFERHAETLAPLDAARAMLERYAALAASGRAVCDWDLEP